MSENIKLSLDLVNESECNELTIKFYIDDNCFYNKTVTPGEHHVTYDFNVEDGDHVFKIELNGKTENHTVVNDDGEIINDVLIKVVNLSIDEISIDQLLHQLAVYEHNYNGNGEFTKDKFFGWLGCNGTVTLNFTSPFYLWLLENM